ncbi:MAG: cysteine--tRNA ligase [Leucobacter sp.]
MNQRIYDSKRQDVVVFAPRIPGTVSMYVCGPTVQSEPHIGHMRSALVYDQMRRWFEASGHEVTLVRNVTDIDDKVLDNARIAQESGANEPWWALAYRMEREFTAANDAIGILPPTYEPRATANIREMIELIERLIERGHAYQANDGSASVYFDTASWPEYGALTRQRRDQMEDAADSEPVGKRDPRDFALWKAHRDSEPESAAWPSPWGSGRPGWHIECSAMATRYLTEEFDIHGGGLDLRFPHHENELAQSSAAGDPFARYWVHNGLVNTRGQKMSKSLGNSLFAAVLLATSRPIVLRYFLGSAHYRSVLEFSPESLTEAEAAFSRIESFVARADEYLREVPSANALSTASLPTSFTDAMLDDFAIPQALAALHGSVRAGNIALEAGDRDRVAQMNDEVVAMLDVLGLNPRDAVWGSGSQVAGDSATAVRGALDALVESLIEQRTAARAAKDFATSDAIRDSLQQAGITLEDSQKTTRWSLS